MTEEKERGILFRGMGDDTGSDPHDADIKTEDPVTTPEEEWDEERQEEEKNGPKEYGILHRESPSEEEEPTGLVPKEPFYKDDLSRHGLLVLILIMIGIPALIFLAGNIAVTAGIITDQTKTIITSIFFIAAVIVLLTNSN